MFFTLCAGIFFSSWAGQLVAWSAFAQDWNGREPGTLSSRYDGHDVLRGSSEAVRQGAISAPLPAFPNSLLKARNQGLVIAEVVIAPEGRVKELLILESFAAEASAAVEAAMKNWRFQHVKELAGSATPCLDCIRISRLGFQFAISDGKPWVIDLADAELKRRIRSSPVTGKRP
jgi:hypothetical protein